jgi:outer membrane protein OmpA-like peptidoglycan-associated protein
MAFSLALSGCAKPGKRTAYGAGIGAAAGAAAGGIIGHQSKRGGKGAAIGAAAGAALGGGIGNYLDKQARELAQVAETKRTEEGIITTLKNNVLFDTDSSALKPQAMDQLSQLSDILKKYPEDRIVVAGHTDSRGGADYNERLSLQRAQAVKLQLISSGLPSESIEALGQGESQPIAPNATSEGMAKNRRVELHITVDQSKL